MERVVIVRRRYSTLDGRSHATEKGFSHRPSSAGLAIARSVRWGATMNVGWQQVLAAPRPGEHIAQLYTDRRFLARGVGRWVGDGLHRGEGVVVITTPLHWRAVVRE